MFMQIGQREVWTMNGRKARTLVTATLVAGALAFGSGISSGAEHSLDRLSRSMQETWKKYQNALQDRNIGQAVLRQLADDYKQAKSNFEKFKRSFKPLPAGSPTATPAGAPMEGVFNNSTPSTMTTTSTMPPNAIPKPQDDWAGPVLNTRVGIDETLKMVTTRQKIGEQDLDVVFESTTNNRLELQSGEAFWQSVTRDLQNASSSIHIQMFGMEADKTGWEFARLLAAKAKSGVKVRLVADRTGARMMGPKNLFKNTEEEKLFKFYKESGVEVVFYDRLTKGTSLKNKLDFYHYDHRKMFLIDGKTAYTGGYTLQASSRETKHDMMVKAEGTVVNQMQASFLRTFLYNKGAVETGTTEELRDRYFPPPTVVDGGDAKLELNVPRYRHTLTDSYMREIDAAKKYLYIINPYITNDEIVKKICAAAKRGVDVRIVHPGTAENPLNDINTRYHFEEMLKAGVKVYLYKGEKGLGKLHGKGLIRDDCFASIGSCNMDTMALRGNYEQNITSRNPTFVAGVRQDLFEKDFAVSTLYVPPASWWERFKIKAKGKATQILDRVD